MESKLSKMGVPFDARRLYDALTRCFDGFHQSRTFVATPRTILEYTRGAGGPPFCISEHASGCSFHNFMNHQRILPLPTGINICILSVSFVFCHCPQTLHFSKSDQSSFRFRVNIIYSRRGRAQPEFRRVQLRGKEHVFIGSDPRFYTVHKRSFLFFTKM